MMVQSAPITRRVMKVRKLALVFDNDGAGMA
jgi:hypothetical protein